MLFEFDKDKSKINKQKCGIDFDEGKDVTKCLDLSKARRPEQEQKRVNVDFPVWMIHSLDKEAKRIGVPRQSIIKIWLAEKLDANEAIN